MPMMGMGQQQQQLMFGQRPPPAQVPQMGSDPFVQAWMAKAQQPPQAQAPQTQAMPGQPPAPAPTPPVANPNDPLAPVAVTPQGGTASGGGSMDKLMSVLKMFGIGA